MTKLREAFCRALSRFRWWAVSVPIYVKILGIGLLITILFAGVAFYQIRSRVLQTHYQVHGETALSVALSLASRLQSMDIVHNKEPLDQELSQTASAFPDVRYIVVQDRDNRILSHGFRFPKEAPPDLLSGHGDLCSACHPALLPKELPSDLLEIPSRVTLPTGSVRAYNRPQGLVLEVTVPIGDGRAGSVRVGVGDTLIARDMRSISLAILWGLALCVAASLFSAIPVMYVLNRPIRALLQATKRVGEGDFSVRAPVHSSDEIGRLAVAFNRMTEGLAESKRQVLRADKLAQLPQFGCPFR